MTKTKHIYFATDIHGSSRCYRKFIKAGEFYKVDTLVLGGDVTGKMLVPLIKESSGDYRSFFLGSEKVIRSADIDNMEKMLKDSGAYPYRTDAKEYDDLKSDEVKRMQLFKELMIERLKEWLTLAEERLRGTGVSVYVTGGNDDLMEIEEVLASSNYVIAAEGKVLEIGEGFEMVSSGYSNITPWNCPRDIPDEALGAKIGAMMPKITDMKKAIFNFHVPPYDTPLDQAPKLDKNLAPIFAPGGGYEMISVGSKAVRNAIEKYQPMLGLHGHIHESRSAVRLGKTTCLNPGSEYGEGILRGVVVTLSDKKGVENFTFTSG